MSNPSLHRFDEYQAKIPCPKVLKYLHENFEQDEFVWEKKTT